MKPGVTHALYELLLVPVVLQTAPARAEAGVCTPGSTLNTLIRRES